MATNRKVLIGLLASAAGLSGWHYLHRSGAVSYQTVPIERGDIRSTVTADGTCSALVTILVGSQVSGNIKALHADFNTQVHKGQLIAEIDPAPFAAKVDQAQAALDGAKAGVAVAQAVAEAAESDIRSARAQVANEEAAVKVALSTESDSKTKFTSREGLGSTIAPEDLETARTTYQVAVAGREAAQAQKDAAADALRSTVDQEKSTQAQVQAAMDQVQQAEAALDQAKLDLAHTQITAPIDGVVISRDMDVGQTVAASFAAPTLFEIAQDLTHMQVDVNIDESDVSRVKVGQAAVFNVDAFPKVTFQAVVQQIRKAPINVQNVITYDVVMTVANPDLKLFPGMTASVHVAAGFHPNILKVRNAAFRYQPLSTRATVASKDETKPKVIYSLDAKHAVIPHIVETGLSDGTYTEIVSGDVHEGDVAIVSSLGP